MRSNEPTTWNHVLYQGDTYSPGEFVVVDRRGAPVDLTSATGTMQAWGTEADPVLSGAVEIIDAAAGSFRWTISAADTEDLTPGAYRFAVQLTLGTTVTTVLVGTLRVERGVRS